MFNDYNNNSKESVQREKLEARWNSSGNKKKIGLTLSFPPPEERKIQVSTHGSPWSLRNDVLSGWVGGGEGRGPSGLTFQMRSLWVTLFFSFFQATLHLMTFPAQELHFGKWY